MLLSIPSFLFPYSYAFFLSLVSFLNSLLGKYHSTVQVLLATALAQAAEYTDLVKILDEVLALPKDRSSKEGVKGIRGSSKEFVGPECETAWVVKKLQEAGAIVIGKTNMHELGTGASIFMSNVLCLFTVAVRYHEQQSS